MKILQPLLTALTLVFCITPITHLGFLGFLFMAIGQADAAITMYEFTGSITKIPMGGVYPERIDDPFAAVFGDFLGKEATFSYLIDTDNIPLPDTDNKYSILSANFSFHTISGSLGANTLFYVYNTDDPDSYTSFGTGFNSNLSSISGVPDGFLVYFTQFTLANLSQKVFDSTAFPITYSLDDFSLKIAQLTFQTGQQSDQLRADFDTLTITNLAPVPEPETYAMMLAGLGLLGLATRRRKQKLNV